MRLSQSQQDTWGWSWSRAAVGLLTFDEESLKNEERETRKNTKKEDGDTANMELASFTTSWTKIKLKCLVHCKMFIGHLWLFPASWQWHCGGPAVINLSLHMKWYILSNKSQTTVETKQQSCEPPCNSVHETDKWTFIVVIALSTQPPAHAHPQL